MRWKKISHDRIADYKNGNHVVYLYDDGTKVKETIDPNADHFTYEFPESFDLKITDYCDAGCVYCAENSTKKGKHADLNKIMPFLCTCPAGTEIAIGGGNALSHPNLQRFLMKLNELKLVPSITVNQKHLKMLITSEIWHLVYGIGVSLTDSTKKEDFKLVNELGKNVVIHVIAGVVKPEDYHVLYGRKILILGYKDLRRGHDNLEKNGEEIKKNIEQLKKDLPMLVKKCKTVSFDCLALKQMNPKEILGMPDEEYNQIYQGDDYELFDAQGNLTVSSMFVDAVNMKVSRSSTAPMCKRYTFSGNENVRELLAKSCEGYDK